MSKVGDVRDSVAELATKAAGMIFPERGARFPLEVSDWTKTERRKISVTSYRSGLEKVFLVLVLPVVLTSCREV